MSDEQNSQSKPIDKRREMRQTDDELNGAINARAANRPLSQRLEAILAAVPDIIMEVDENKVYTWANYAGKTFFGDDVIGKEAAHYFEGAQETYAVVSPLFEGSEDVIYLESWQRRRDGEVRLLAWWCRVLKDAAGEVIGALSTARDITEARRAEEEVRRLKEELEQRVERRTAELAAANKELEAFAYSVSHDLRAPLRAIDGFTRILADEYASRLDAEGRRLCAIVRENAVSMDVLINSILALSRLSRVEMSLSNVDMATLAASVFHELTDAEARERIDFQVDAVPPAMADTTLMRQVWTNLVSNAVKFSSKRDRAVIRIGGEQRKGEVVYSVRDNGAGFDMQYQSKLFGVFQRLHTVREFEGTGVGLAIVQRAVHRHGGRVWAKGKTGEGAMFYFALPDKGAE
jgi:PAS domain S-box-containing protein